MATEKGDRSQSEYDTLVSQKKTVKNNYDAAINKRTELQNKINRLNAVKSEVTSLKTSFKALKSIDSSTKKTKRKWKGRNYTRYSNNMGNLIDENNNYYDHIDYILDNINNQLLQFTLELNSNNSLINKLWAQFKKLGTKVENYWN